jgi:peptidyl-prolyl cis-trans isomerase A (cyclophilin A)
LAAGVENFSSMKAIHLLCAFSVLAAVIAAKAEDTNSAEKNLASPSFADPSKLTEKAPDTFKAQFDTTKGKFTIEVTRALSPNGADRFYNLVRSGYFKDIAFFRVIPGFMCQFGIHGDPAVAAKWRDANISDDPVKGSNTRGAITFATAGPNTRTTQLFINFGDNARLDGMGFSPFGKVSDGMDVVDKINGEYGEGAPGGMGPDQGRVQNEGNAYLKKDFPNLDYIKSATILPAEKKEETAK